MVRGHSPCLLNHLITPELCSELFRYLIHLRDRELTFFQEEMKTVEHLRVNDICLRSVPQYLCKVRTLLWVHFNHPYLMLCSKCTQIVGIEPCRFIDELSLVPVGSIPLLEQLLQGLQTLLIGNLTLLCSIPELQRLL